MSERQKSLNELEGPVTEVPIDIPERTILVRCPHCRHAIDAGVLKQNLDVCPRCGKHMRIGARRRLALTADQGSFEEWDADIEAKDILSFPDYKEKLAAARQKSGGEKEAVICGKATIQGEPCALFIMNGDFMMGSMGAAVGEKICRCFERATEEDLPVVGFTVSGGARMQEGLTSLMQMAKVSNAVRRHSAAGLLYICVLTDPTSGGVTASFAMEADITIAEPDALVAFAGPRVVEQTTHKKLPQGFQRSEFVLAHGFCDLVVERKEIPSTLGYLLWLHDEEAWGTREAPKCAAAFPEEARWPLPHHLEKPAAADASAYDLVKRVRNADRPSVPSIMDMTFEGFIELHGDHEFGDDAAIADNLVAMGALRTPEITVIMGEGGSGGALGLAVSDRVLMLSDAVYSVVSPEGCSTILFKTAKRAADAAEALGITAPFLKDLGIIDGIVDAEGFGTEEFAERFRKCLADQVQELEGMTEDELVDARYEKYRAIGRRDS